MLLYGVGFLSAALGDIAMILYIVLSLIVVSMGKMTMT